MKKKRKTRVRKPEIGKGKHLISEPKVGKIIVREAKLPTPKVSAPKVGKIKVGEI